MAMAIPNTATDFSDAVGALYSIAYAAKFAIKRAPDGVDYGVLPLEGLFWALDMSAGPPEARRKHLEPPCRGSVLRALRRGTRSSAHAHRPLRPRGPDDRATTRLHRPAGL